MDTSYHTASPTSSGTSVVGIKYKDGVIIASDMKGSYGSMAKFFDIERVVKINRTTVLGNSGDIADFQYLHENKKERIHEDSLYGVGFDMSPAGLHTYITRVLYNRRSRMDPLWSSYIVGGFQDGKSFLGYADMRGVAYEDCAVATGVGKFLAIPKLRDAVDLNEELSEDHAKQAIIDALTVLYYRDCRAGIHYQIAVINKDGVHITGPRRIIDMLLRLLAEPITTETVVDCRRVGVILRPLLISEKTDRDKLYSGLLEDAHSGEQRRQYPYSMKSLVSFRTKLSPSDWVLVNVVEQQRVPGASTVTIPTETGGTAARTVPAGSGEILGCRVCRCRLSLVGGFGA